MWFRVLLTLPYYTSGPNRNRKPIVFSGFVVLFLLFTEYAKALQRS